MNSWKTFTLCFFTLFFTACSVNKKTSTTKSLGGTSPETTKGNTRPTGDKNYPKSNSTQQYINKYKDIAVKEMRRTGIPASITLAQGIFESSSGNSDLAINANNHFGIKCTSDWQGEGYQKDDDKPNECFRKYPHAEGSFHDHSEFLKRPRYAALFKLEPTDYTSWANGLKTAGYATNPQYGPKLIELIERYELYRFDKHGAKDAIATTGNRGSLYFEQKQTNEGDKQQTVFASAEEILPAGQYRVKAGDTLYGIAKKFNTKVENIVTWNNLESYSIEVGQVLKVSK
ncbi:glucosaminidase domain-containing protein [Solitalea lacus]|uniref:glucosaminidase domain-containing protein n=1 Tax=Solitalea lacus TaxID=2911172 RepID=UPI001EDBCC57|nr:glucosaminidase domain-containing protein [Solitalea lacus]UKJ07433.1 glucosaminidase domain-containing protein [Solitalea lacus]